MGTDALLEQMRSSPQFPRYVEAANHLWQEEQRKRKRFIDEVREDQKAEFINGEVIVHSPTEIQHTEIERNAVVLLTAFVQRHRLGWVGHEKVLISLSRNDYEPDIVFFGRKKAQTLKPTQRRSPAPDLIVEVLSSSTEKNDRVVKFQDYAAHGVSEYWLVDPRKKAVEQYLLAEGTYRLELKSGSGEIKSAAIAGLRLPIRAFFDADENLKALQAIVH